MRVHKRVSSTYSNKHHHHHHNLDLNCTDNRTEPISTRACCVVNMLQQTTCYTGKFTAAHDVFATCLQRGDALCYRSHVYYNTQFTTVLTTSFYAGTASALTRARDSTPGLACSIAGFNNHLLACSISLIQSPFIGILHRLIQSPCTLDRNTSVA